ncbi:MAG: DsbA family protein [Xanthomonadaceae bacterium]|jgi:protein-disulfide isomerase|nr:DsbA family protein [Xanthomonadaceae bacterium]
MSDLKPHAGPQDHHQGNLNAPLVLVEYGDFQCPYCSIAHALVKRLQHRFGDRFCFVFRQFPLRQLHPHAQRAAELSEAAGSQGLFWPMYDLLFEHQKQLDDQSLVAYAEKAGLDRDTIRDAFEGEFAHIVETDLESGIESGVEGTPRFFINDFHYEGDTDFESMSAVLEDILSSQRPGYDRAG